MAQRQQIENQGELFEKRIAARKGRDMMNNFVQKVADFDRLLFTARVQA
jgi:hypothetical protein